MEYLTDGERHLICVPYSIENLHKMADDLGIKRCWFHSGKFKHYDIPKRRIAEIESKCRMISSRELLFLIKGSGLSVSTDEGNQPDPKNEDDSGNE